MNKKRGLRKTARWALAEVRQHYLLTLLAILTSGLILVAFAWYGGSNGELWTNVAAGFLTNLWTFVIIYLLLVRRGVSLPGMHASSDMGALVEFYPQHEEVDWPAIIRSARHIDIVVHYYDRWVRENSDEFKALFEKGGTVRLILPDAEDARTVEAVQYEFFPDHTVERLKEKIADTAKFMEQSFTEAASAKATLEVYGFPRTLHFAAVIADHRHVYLSVYEQFRGPVIRSSVFHLDLGRDSKLEDYWQATLRDFIRDSRRLR